MRNAGVVRACGRVWEGRGGGWLEGTAFGWLVADGCITRRAFMSYSKYCLKIIKLLKLGDFVIPG